ncbi:MAG TPA: metallophosphoesterase [Kofleriaceae bacterium]|nr:metallophosphoesterase [Kofleriaceae bacterium]
MSTGSKYVVDLMEHRFDIHSTQGTNTGVPGAFDPIADAEKLAERRRELAAMRTRLADDPQAVLDEFRAFLHMPGLTFTDLDEYMKTWEFALDHPDEFAQGVETGLESFGLGDWFNRVRAYLHAPKSVSASDRKVLDELRQRYPIIANLDINPNNRQFETYDPAWVPLLNKHLAEKRGTWPDLEPFRYHDAFASGFIYPSSLRYDGGGIRIGVMSDFGTGLSHAEATAHQLEGWQLPYVFHLGDVYYAGRQEEFKTRFAKQLEQIVAKSRFFGLPENHELFSGGKYYRMYYDGLLADHPTLQAQEGSYFCVPFEHHQIIGIDVNWHARQTFLDPKERSWLAARLAEANGRTNILLTGSAPYYYPSKDRNRLLSHLWEFVRSGQVHLWFWGDDHYCALFSRHATVAPFIGSCIGHAGFPGERKESEQQCWTPPLWVEDEPRFPAWTNLHQDAGNNGWCQLTLGADRSVELLYVDWLGAKRCQVSLVREGDVLVPRGLRRFDGRGDKDMVPDLHMSAG